MEFVVYEVALGQIFSPSCLSTNAPFSSVTRIWYTHMGGDRTKGFGLNPLPHVKESCVNNLPVRISHKILHGKIYAISYAETLWWWW